MYCIPIWAGARKTKFLTLKRALIKVMYFENIIVPTDLLYELSRLLTVRKLYVMHIILRKHKSLPNKLNLENKRRKDIIVHASRNRTLFASIQQESRS